MHSILQLSDKVKREKMPNSQLKACDDIDSQFVLLFKKILKI